MKLTIITSALAAITLSAGAQSSKAMQFTLKPLPYPINALEPHMSAKTLEFHWGKHLATYVTNTNNLKAGTPLENAPLEEIIVKSDGPLFNNAAQIFNHDFFFETFSATPLMAPEGELKAAIDKQYGSLENFKEQFNKTAIGLFGAGWAWFATDKAGALQIIAESNAGNPLKKGLIPLLGVDVWEHSYYLDVQNRRADYLANFWKIVDWTIVDNRYNEVVK